MKTHIKINRGFTLMELLAVIALIGILSTITFASFSGAREKARDAERVSELGQLALAAERYYDACGEYPSSLGVSVNNGSCPSGVTFGSFVGTSVPVNIGGTAYGYSVSGGSFTLSVTLELDSNPALDDDVDGGSCDDPVYCISS